MFAWIRRHSNALGFAACILIVAIGFGALGAGIARLDSASKSNKRAIFVGCTLLANVIIQTGVSSTQNDEANQLFLAAIQRVMTPAERERFRAAIASRQPAGNVVIPSCKRISEHPDEVRAIPLPTPTPTPTRSP